MIQFSFFAFNLEEGYIFLEICIVLIYYSDKIHIRLETING